MNHTYDEFSHLEGERVQFWYKPSSRSMRWRPGFINLCFGPIAYDYGKALAAQEQWYDWKFGPCLPGDEK